MSWENVELVRSIRAAWRRGDFSSTEWAHPEIEFVFADGPAPGRWRGVAGMADAWREFLSAWDEWRTVDEDYRELDDERVLVLTHASGRGKASELQVGQFGAKGASLYHMRGRVTRLVLYWDRERALSDLRLAPDTDAGSRS